MKIHFKIANEAYEYYHDRILLHGIPFGDTKALFNVGFYLNNPNDKMITNKERKWSLDYAEAEWQWYLTGDPKVSTLGDIYGKVPEIWKRMADSNGNVNSNYGWQWQRNDQLDKVINLLKHDKYTRQAAISIYDGKEIHAYENDTPCTYAVQFTIMPKTRKLNMAVVMRSNDLWFGFCNDQYCFANLQMLVAYELGIDVGEYYHYAHNLHLYNNKL